MTDNSRCSTCGFLSYCFVVLQQQLQGQSSLDSVNKGRSGSVSSSIGSDLSSGHSYPKAPGSEREDSNVSDSFLFRLWGFHWVKWWGVFFPSCGGNSWSSTVFVFHVSSHLPRSLADRWGTTVDFTTSFLHSLRFSALRRMIFHSRPVHSLMSDWPWREYHVYDLVHMICNGRGWFILLAGWPDVCPFVCDLVVKTLLNVGVSFLFLFFFCFP